MTWAAGARERERREKIYLTIREIVDDLNADRKDELSQLRDETNFDR